MKRPDQHGSDGVRETPEPLSIRRVTVRDIARAAGVSHSTVSRALQGSPLVKKVTREKLVRLAEEMGYRPDPMLSALTAYRSRINLRRQRNALAFVLGPYIADSWGEILDSAHTRAEKLGFDLQRYIWRSDLSGVRQSEILRSRGVRGVIAGPLTKENRLIELPINAKYFSLVAIGRFISHPRINTVTPNHFGSVQQAMAKLREYGYRRIGLALLERLNIHVDDRIRTAFLGCQSYLPEEEQVPVCHPCDEASETEQIVRWIKAEQPDAVLSYNHVHRNLVEAGVRIPEEIAFASLNLNHRNEGRLAGTNVNDRMVGQVAVNLLNSQLLVGETGEPEVRQTLIVDTFWEDGPTVPVRIHLNPSTRTVVL